MLSRSQSGHRRAGRNLIHTYLVAVGLAVIPLSIFIFGAHNLIKRETTSRLVTQSSRSGQMFAGLIERPLLESISFLQAFAERPDVQAHWQRSENGDLASSLDRAHQLRSDFAAIGLYDVSGALRSSTPPNAKLFGEGYEPADLFAAVSHTDKSYVSPAFRTPDSGGYSIAIAVPVHDQKHTLMGIAVARESLDTATRDVYAYASAETRPLIFVADTTGNIFGRQGNQFVLVPGNRALVDRLAASTNAESGEHLRLGAQDVIAAYVPIPSVGWGVLVSVPIPVLNDLLYKGERQLAVFAGILFLIAMLTGLVVAATIERFRTREQHYLEQIEQQNTELQLQRGEAVRANEMKSRFLANMSHELRTPLNSILGFSELLHDQSAGALNDKQMRWVANIRTAGRHLLQLINDILDLSKIEAGQLTISTEKFVLSAALPEVLSVIRPLAMAKQIVIEQHVESDILVSADRVRLKQVLYNLLSNAVKFSPPKSTIFVSAAKEGPFCRISVRDQGMGIPADKVDFIFEEFSQLDTPDSRDVVHGTGLGLAITRRLVEKQGGTISVKSQLGQGTEFVFSIPLADTTTQIKEVRQIQGPRLRERPLVLAIDDESAALEVLSEHLHAAGYDVSTAMTLQDGLRMARELVPDVVTLDILMPSGSGWAVLADLKSDASTAHIPVVVVSILDRQDVGFALGASDYLVKPIQKSSLLSTMRRLLGGARERSRVLIVDDNLDDLNVMTEVAVTAGFDTETATTGGEGLRKLNNSDPNLVLLDLMLPDLNGLEVLEKIRNEPRFANLPVVIVTAKDLTSDEMRVIERSATAHVQKVESWKKDVLRRMESTLRKRSAV